MDPYGPIWTHIPLGTGGFLKVTHVTCPCLSSPSSQPPAKMECLPFYFLYFSDQASFLQLASWEFGDGEVSFYASDEAAGPSFLICAVVSECPSLLVMGNIELAA